MEPGAVRKIRNLKRGDAVIAFSRRDVLMWRDMITDIGLSVATVYGNLSPEVRRAQAERFREGQADIVVGTDALAMGLNMPIERIVMTTAVKYNGVEEEEISAALAKQIAGRAGRYGVHEEGFVAGYDDDTHEVMRSLMKEKIPPVPATGFAVAPSLEQLHRIASVTGETSLVKLLRRFVHNIDVPDGFSTRASRKNRTNAPSGSTPSTCRWPKSSRCRWCRSRPGADPGKRLEPLGAVAGEEKDQQAAAASAGTVLAEPAGSRRHLPHVLGLCLAGLPDAGLFPQHRAGPAAGARGVGAGGFAAAAAECGGA
jgi:superfamily II DNA/RNA helicase